jgi:hypothetical protein
VAAPTTAPKRRKKGEPGFEHARPDELIERLRDLPGKRGGGEG